ncbi:MAG: hypothetical protein PHI35_00275, partial [Victivallaceae bacterium]|nr:hypothetical protein [Victivallaceae bacterium]
MNNVAPNTSVYNQTAESTETVLVQGSAYTTTVNGTVNLDYDTAYMKDTVISGGVVNAINGEIVDTTMNGGEMKVSAGAVASGLEIFDGYGKVEAGGKAYNVTIHKNTGNYDITGYVENLVASNAEVQLDGNGVVSSMTLYNAGVAKFWQGGTIEDITVLGGGTLWTGRSTAISKVKLNGGQVWVEQTGGSLSDVTIYNGTEYVGGGAEVDGTVMSGGIMEVYGVAKNTVMSGGQQYVKSGGTVSGMVIHNGYSHVTSGAEAYDVTVYSINGNYDIDGGHVERLTTNASVKLNGEGYVSGLTIANGGVVDFVQGGTLDNVTIQTGGTLWTGRATAVSDVKIAGGDLWVEKTLGSLGAVTIYSGREYVLDGAVANNTVISGGEQNVNSGCVASGTTLFGGVQNVNGTAYNTVMSGGEQYVKNGGVASGTEIFNGYSNVASGAEAYDVTIHNINGNYDIDGGHVER